MIQAAGQNRPRVVGVDGHSTHKFRVTNNQGVFPDATSIKDFHAQTGNDAVNVMICRVLHENGIDCIFSSRLESVMSYVRDESCRALMIHPHREEMESTGKLLLLRKDLLVIIIFSFFPEFQSMSSVVGLPHLYQLEERLLAIVKPHGVHDLATYLKTQFSELKS